MTLLVIKCQARLAWLTDIEMNSRFQKIEIFEFFLNNEIIILLKYSYFCILKFPNLWKLDFQSLNFFIFKSVQVSSIFALENDF